MNKCVTKKMIKAIMVFFIAIVVGLICFWTLCMFIFLRIDDYFKYKHSVSSKEEMFQMVIEEQEELELLVQEMKDRLDQSEKDFILYYSEKEGYANKGYEENGLESELFDKYPIFSVSIDGKNQNGQLEVTLDFTFCPNPYNYWGIYYTENGEPSSWGGNLEEVEGVLTETGSYYKYETEKIVGNWYYWQCMTR